jgi:hypothetical protein
MPKRQFITLRTPHSNQDTDLEVPGDEPIRDILPDMLKAIHWPGIFGEVKVNAQLKTEDGAVVDSSQSLSKAGFENFDVLCIDAVSLQAVTDDGPKQDNGACITFAPPDGEETPSESFLKLIRVDCPSLLHADGIIFSLGNPPISIGRSSHDYKPDVDLSELDKNLIASRKHAEILKKEKHYILRSLSPTNGTLLNGSPLENETETVLQSGDVILFGFRGVALTFRLPEK